MAMPDEDETLVVDHPTGAIQRRASILVRQLPCRLRQPGPAFRWRSRRRYVHQQLPQGIPNLMRIIVILLLQTLQEFDYSGFRRDGIRPTVHESRMQSKDGLGSCLTIGFVAHVQDSVRRQVAKLTCLFRTVGGNHDHVAGPNHPGIVGDVVLVGFRPPPPDYRCTLPDAVVICAGSLHVGTVVFDGPSRQPASEHADRHRQRLTAARWAQEQEFQRRFPFRVQFQIRTPAHLHIRDAFARTVQEHADVGRRGWGWASLCPTIDVGGKHHGSVAGRGVECCQRIAFRQQPVEGRDSEIDFAPLVSVGMQPRPRPAEGLAINGIITFYHPFTRRVRLVCHCSSLIPTDENHRPRIDGPPHAVQAAETLTQRIKARAFRHEAIEVEVGPDFQSLGSHDDQRLFQSALFGLIGVEQFQTMLDDSILVHGPHTAGEQDRTVSVNFAQQPVNLPGRGNAVDEYNDRPTLFTEQLLCGLGHCLRQRMRGLASLGVCDGLEDCGLVRRLASAERMAQVATLVGLILEHVRHPWGRRGRHDHGGKTPFERSVRPSLETLDRPQGLEKRLGAMGFVEKDEAVVRDESGIDRPSARAASIGAEQQARADLIHRGCDHRRLQRIPRPRFGAVHAAA